MVLTTLPLRSVVPPASVVTLTRAVVAADVAVELGDAGGVDRQAVSAVDRRGKGDVAAAGGIERFVLAQDDRVVVGLGMAVVVDDAAVEIGGAAGTSVVTLTRADGATPTLPLNVVTPEVLTVRL